MKWVSPYCLLLVSSLCCLGWAAKAQKPGNRGGFIQMLDSLGQEKAIHHHSATNPAPAFPQAVHVARVNPQKSAKPGVRNAGMVVCFDTSGRYFLQNDAFTFYVSASNRWSDGNVMVSGEFVNRNPPYSNGGFLMKCNDTGRVIWARLYDSLGHTTSSFINYLKILELNDGSVLLHGRTTNNVTNNEDMLMTHTDNAGNITWSKAYASRLWQGFNGTGDRLTITQMKQDPASGDIFFTGGHFENGKNVTRLKITDGSIVWSKVYDFPNLFSFEQPFGLDIRRNDLLVFSKSGTAICLFRINKNTGDTMSTRFLQSVETDPNHPNYYFVVPNELVKLDNGHYAICGKFPGYHHSLSQPLALLYHAGIAEVDDQLNFVKAYCIRNNIESNYFNTKITVHKDGTGLFSMLEYIDAYNANVYYLQFKDGQVLKQRVRNYRNEGLPDESNSLQMEDGSDLVVKTIGDFITNTNKIEFLDLHMSDTASACLGLSDNSSFIEPFRLVPVSITMGAIGSNEISESTNKTLSSWLIDMDYAPACRLLSYCDTLSLHPSADSICISAPMTITVRKSPSCGAFPFMQYDTTQVAMFQQQNDSVFNVRFRKPGAFTLQGSIYGCRQLDAITKIVVLDAPGPVNLGPDTVICPNNTLRLQAKSGYASYSWQDQSADSVFIVRKPGVYSVAVTDFCGNVFRDTINVLPRSIAPIDIGPDARICQGASFTIIAPAGFIRYSWSPNYAISSLSAQTVQVTPARDTMYFLQAEKTPGCFAKDSIRISIDGVAPVNLGADTSFCSGQQLVLNAGTGYASYQWNNGSTQPTQTVTAAGTYSVTVKNAGGCAARDTLRVLQLFALPAPDLGSDTIICSGTTRVLNAGNFASYAWNTGSTASSIVVQQPGFYWVQVTDKNQCTGADSLQISTIITPPANFLPADTSICNYGTLLLQPNKTFSTYHWSTGASGAAVTVNTAGVYWLEAQDVFNCTGRDTIKIVAKDCMYGFYVPNAFSPGHDGKNDLFRPLVFGTLLQYEFTIYNRFGQVVFNSHTPQKGWDGGAAATGNPPSSNVYVWVCRYQLANEPLKIEKGTVLLLR